MSRRFYAAIHDPCRLGVRGDARLKRKETGHARGRHPPCRTGSFVPAVYGGRTHHALAALRDALSDRAGGGRVAVELHPQPSADLAESEYSLSRALAAAAICGSLQYILA